MKEEIASLLIAFNLSYTDASSLTNSQAISLFNSKAYKQHLDYKKSLQQLQVDLAKSTNQTIANSASAIIKSHR